MLGQEIELKGVGRSDQVANIFTKAFAKPKIEHFRIAIAIPTENIFKTKFI